MSLCIVYLASPRDFRTEKNGKGHLRYDVLKASLFITRRLFPNTDIYVFHEDYTEEDMKGLPRVTKFEKVDFSGFENIYNTSLPTNRGYLMMCRFFSGVMQRHPLLQKYTHYMRLDDDSYFLEPYLTEQKLKDFFAYDYIFRALFYENKSQQSLFDFTMKFIGRIIGPIRVFQIKRALVARKFLHDTGMYTGLAPYNNFHVSSLQLWNHPIVRRYIDEIEASGGIFRNGWLDANIHAMIMYVFPFVIPKLSVTPYLLFGYRHNYHICPYESFDAVYDTTVSFYPKWLDATISSEEVNAPDVTIPRPGKLVLATFANTDYMPLDRIVNHAKHFNVFDQIYPYTEHDFPKFFEKHRTFLSENRLVGYGRWIWKPMLILETLLKLSPGDIVIYVDAGVHLNKHGLTRLAEYISMLDNTETSIVSFAASFDFGYGYLHPSTIQSFFPEFSYETHRYHYAGVIIAKQSEESIQFFRDYLSLCENYEFLSYEGGDSDNGLYNLCLAKHKSIVKSIYPDEVHTKDNDWSKLTSYPFHCRRIRPLH